jgi:hypothetical protein
MSRTTRQGWWFLACTLASSAAAGIENPVEELPRPTPAAAADVQSEPATSSRRDNSATGWSLKGEGGQHFFVNDVAVADYTWKGQRHIVQLDRDNPAREDGNDPYFVYYRERETGNRWAIGRYPSSSQDYAVYFQPSNRPKVWTRFHRARMSRNDDRSAIVVDAIVVIESPATVSIPTEPRCGN